MEASTYDDGGFTDRGGIRRSTVNGFSSPKMHSTIAFPRVVHVSLMGAPNAG